jgi:hypothetical protein
LPKTHNVLFSEKESAEAVSSASNVGSRTFRLFSKFFVKIVSETEKDNAEISNKKKEYNFFRTLSKVFLRNISFRTFTRTLNFMVKAKKNDEKKKRFRWY